MSLESAGALQLSKCEVLIGIAGKTYTAPETLLVLKNSYWERVQINKTCPGDRME